MYLGCDPEIFLTDAAGGLVSSINKIGGSKEFPKPLPLGQGFCVQEDNVAIEFNIPPADSMDEFIFNVNLARNYLSDEVAKMGLKFINSSAEFFPEKELQEPAAMEFGCDPDFNAWKGGSQNPRPESGGEDWKLRTAGGHVHVGHTFEVKKDVLAFVQYMDLFLGVPSVLMDKGDLRKSRYGAAGAFRFKPYGVEYRTLSNFWIFDDKLIAWVWTQTAAAMDAWQNNKKGPGDAGSIIAAINENNKFLAHDLVHQHQLRLV